MTAPEFPLGGRCDVLFYVQHLLGVGHLRRAAVIARALDRAGLTVVFASGGLPDPNLALGGARLVQLAPARVRDESFAQLVDAEGRDVGEACRAERRFHLLQLLQHCGPRVLLTEMFPFGRRQMRFELLPLLQAARKMRPRPWIVSSLRDVLTTHKTLGKTEWILETFTRFYDLVLVHGDPALIPLERSFPRAGEIAGRLRYTGYVVEHAPPPNGARGTEVLVSTGGGAVARPLVEAAVQARALSPLAAAPWRILIGHGLDEAGFAALRAAAPPGVTIERSRPDFLALLARAALSISQAGYNTTLEVLAAGTPAIVVPFAAGSETEQALRAQLLAERGLLTVVPEAELSPRRLAEAVSAAVARPSRPSGGIGFDLNGAEKTADLLRELAATAIVPS